PARMRFRTNSTFCVPSGRMLSFAGRPFHAPCTGKLWGPPGTLYCRAGDVCRLPDIGDSAEQRGGIADANPTAEPGGRRRAELPSAETWPEVHRAQIPAQAPICFPIRAEACSAVRWPP